MVKSQVFRVSKCSNATKTKDQTPCRPKEEIDEYIKDLVIDIWAFEYQFDSNKYES